MQAALAQCGPQDPIEWLRTNWDTMIANVQTLATKYGVECPENRVGTVSETEARDALRLHKGNIWAAVTECVEQRQKKVFFFKSLFMKKVSLFIFHVRYHTWRIFGEFL